MAKIRARGNKLIHLCVDHENKDVWVNGSDHDQVFLFDATILREGHFQIQNGTGHESLINRSFSCRYRKGIT